MELSFIGGKDFPRRRCVLTRFHTGDGHDKTPEIGRTLVADHVRNVAWVSPFHLPRGLRQLCIYKSSKQANNLTGGMWQTSHTAGGMWIGLVESHGAGGTDQGAGC